VEKKFKNQAGFVLGKTFSRRLLDLSTQGFKALEEEKEKRNVKASS